MQNVRSLYIYRAGSFDVQVWSRKSMLRAEAA